MSGPTIVGTDLQGNNVVAYAGVYFVIPPSMGAVDPTAWGPEFAFRPEGIKFYTSQLQAQTASMPALYNTTQGGHIPPRGVQTMKDLRGV
jgi:hypothetical protein